MGGTVIETESEKLIKKGIQQGMQQGMQQGKFEIARKLIEMGLPMDQIAAATGLSQTEIENIYSTV